LVRGLPAQLPAAVFVIVHVPPFVTSYLPQILTDAGRLPAVHPEDGAFIRHGQILVAPPDRHLFIENGHVLLGRGPKENRNRPAINPSFRSAALAYGSRVVGVILSGVLNDGTAGLGEIKRCGGIAIIQDPLEAIFPDMPQGALDKVAVDHIARADKIATLLVHLAS
jgi:two-component system chemotaxis response regulator CheB